MDIDVSDLNRLTATIAELSSDLMPKIEIVTRKACADTKRDAQAFCPVDTGNLRASIGYDVTRDGKSVAGEVGPTASYGGFVEFGTSRMAPHAYMGPAFDRHAGEYVQALTAIGIPL